MASEPIAVVGLGCVLPDAFDVAAFWERARRGVSSVRPLAGETWAWARYLDETGRDPDRALSALGAQILGWRFDWRRFRVPPADAAAVNPLQWMVLEAGAQALLHVKHVPHETTGLFLGATGLGWQKDTGLRIHLGEALEAIAQAPSFRALPPALQKRALDGVARELDVRLAPVSDDNVVGAAASVAAGRIAMHFDLHGLHYAVDAGFASALAAVDVGVRALRDGTLDCAVVGGVSEMITPLELVAFSRMGGIARTHVAPFCETAEGTLLGEGAALFCLKRLDDAQRDGDTIHAVLRGVGGASDGRGKSVLAPRAEGQALAMKRAYDDAGVDPAALSFVECHATGTPVGDVSEVRALASVVPSSSSSHQRIWLGSAKAQVGHLRAGAGAAALLRAVLAVRERVMPKQIGVARVNPLLELGKTPFAVPLAEQPLSSSTVTAGVSAFGFCGNDFHAVIESAPPVPSPRIAVPAGAPSPSPSPRAPIAAEPIAIVGMGGIFPTGADVASFWQSLLDGQDATRTVPPERFSVERFCDPDPARLDTSYSKLGCFLDELPRPSARLGIPPAAWKNIDPSQALALAAAEQALANVPLTDRDRVAVMLAFLPYQGVKFSADTRVTWREYEHELSRELEAAGVDDATRARVCEEAERAFKRDLPPLTEDSLPGWLGALCAGRITREHDLHGAHFVVDSACASTHAAVHAAVTALRHRSADVVLTGGVWCDMRPEFFVAACRFNALSATGEKPFDKSADGFIPGEGAGVFALMRLDDAVREGREVIAVIRAVAGSSDGRGRSVLAPTPEGEALAMKRALAAAGVSPNEVAYVECHGTGTALGDVVEVEAVQRAYAGSEPREKPLLIGSVKSNIGHLNAAAGVPALMKVALSLSTGTLPPSLKCGEPNPAIDWKRGPVEVVTSLRALEPIGSRRLAALSGFGVGGSNMHLVVEEWRKESARGPRIALSSGADGRACAEALRAGAAGQGPVTAAVVVGDEGLERGLALLASGAPAAVLRASGVLVADASTRGGKVALCFPGQGAQYAGMAAALSASFAPVRATFAEVDDAYARITGRALTPAFAGALSDEDAHCAVFAVAVAVARLLAREFGVRSDAVLGQSAGEIAALVAAEALSLEDGLRLLSARTRAVLALSDGDAGKMVALRCGAERARGFFAQVTGFLVVAADNSQNACLVSGETAACAALVDAAAQAGVEASVLPVSHAYHSRMIGGAQGAYARALDAVSFAALAVPLYSSVTGDVVTAPPLMKLALLDQLVKPVRLQEAVRAAWRDGVRVFVECGPKWPLCTFIDEILADKAHVALPTLHPKTGEVLQLSRALAGLAAHGRATVPRAAPAPVAAPPVPVAPLAPAPPATAVSARDDEPLRRLLARVKDAIGAYLDETATTPPATSARAVLELLAPVARALPVAREPAAAAPPHITMPPVTVPPVTVPATVPATVPTAMVPAVVPPTTVPPSTVAATTVAATTTTAAPAAAALAGARPDPMALLVDALAQRTGYPPDMLEPDLDLEADLGIDTVKQVAVIADVKQRLGLPRDPQFKLRDHNTLRKVAAYLAQKQAPPQKKRGGARFDDVRRTLLELTVARTGYPAEMLELDLDLEADLGIDTVKQVAIVSELKQRFALPRDPQFKLRDHNTLKKIIDHVVDKTGGAESSSSSPASPRPPAALEAPPPAPDSPPPRTEQALAVARPQTAAAPPPPSWKQVLDVPAVEDAVDVVARLIEGARRAGHIGRLAAIEHLALAPAPQHGAVVVDAADAGGSLLVRMRSATDGTVAASAALQLAHGLSAGGAPRAAPREIAAAAGAPVVVENGAAAAPILAAVSAWPAAAELLSVDVPAFDEVVAHVRFAATPTGGTDAGAAASLVAAAAGVLAVNASALLGVPCALAAVAAARFARVPSAGEHLALVAHAHGARGGDVDVVDDHGHLVASFQGVALVGRAGAPPLSRETWARVRQLGRSG